MKCNLLSSDQSGFNLHMHKMGPQGPKHYIFCEHFYWINTRKPNTMYASILMLENIWYYPIHKRLWIFNNLVRVPGDSQLEQNSQHIVNSVHFR